MSPPSQPHLWGLIPWGSKDLDTTEWLTHIHIHTPAHNIHTAHTHTHLPPHLTPWGCHIAPGLSSPHHTANSLWLSILHMVIYMFQVAQAVKRLPAIWETRVDPSVGKIPWRRKWQPPPVLLPRKFHGWRSLVGYSPWGRRVGHDCATWLYSLWLLYRFIPPSPSPTSLQVPFYKAFLNSSSMYTIPFFLRLILIALTLHCSVWTFSSREVLASVMA